MKSVKSTQRLINTLLAWRCWMSLPVSVLVALKWREMALFASFFPGEVGPWLSNGTNTEGQAAFRPPGLSLGVSGDVCRTAQRRLVFFCRLRCGSVGGVTSGLPA